MFGERVWTRVSSVHFLHFLSSLWGKQNHKLLWVGSVVKTCLSDSPCVNHKQHASWSIGLICNHYENFAFVLSSATNCDLYTRLNNCNNFNNFSHRNLMPSKKSFTSNRTLDSGLIHILHVQKNIFQPPR